MAFDDVRLRTDIERGAKGGPSFETTIVALSSGKEQRNASWQVERNRWDIAYGIQDKNGYREVIDFFRARRGRHRGFRFRDWTDYQATDELIGTGDGVNRVFQLVKNYEITLYQRRITRPVSPTVTIKIDDVLKPSGYSVNYSTGVVTFTDHADHIPAVDEEVTASFEFDIPVRFDKDYIEAALEWVGAGRLPNIAIMELLE